MYTAGEQGGSATYGTTRRASNAHAEDSGYLDVADGGQQRQPSQRSRAASAQLGMAGNDDFASMMDDILNADKRINDERLKKLEEQNRQLAERMGVASGGAKPADTTAVQMDDEFDGFGGAADDDDGDEGLYDEPAVAADADTASAGSGSYGSDEEADDE